MEIHASYFYASRWFFPTPMHIGNKNEKISILNRLLSRQHVLIHGKQGIGKTSFVRLFNKAFDILEFNTSRIDYDHVPRVDTLESRTFDNKNRVVFFDEIDCVKSEKLNEVMIKYLNQHKFPVVLVANYIDKIHITVREHPNVEIYQFTPPTSNEMRALLETKTSDVNAINKAIKIARGDVRQALKILVGSHGYETRTKISTSRLATMVASSKNRESVYRIVKNGEKTNENSLFTLIIYLSYNIFNINENSNDVLNNVELLSMLNTMLYKFSRNDYAVSLLSYCFKPGRRTIRMQYPRYNTRVKKVKRDG